jgi:hypothetical protein
MRHTGFTAQIPHFMIVPEAHQPVNRTPVIWIKRSDEHGFYAAPAFLKEKKQ